MIKNFESYNKLDFLKSLNINFSDFNLFEKQFDCPRGGHGINHTFRVMLSCLVIGRDLNDIITTKRSFMTAYIHDMARKHDYWCDVHGKNSAKEKLPIYENLFIKNGADEEDIEAIKLAVINHSERFEVDKDNPYYKCVALLRDSDALDLIRMDMIVKPELLRFKESVKYIPVLEKLYIETDNIKYNSFNIFLKENIKYYDI